MKCRIGPEGRTRYPGAASDEARAGSPGRYLAVRVDGTVRAASMRPGRIRLGNPDYIMNKMVDTVKLQ
ncbi:MAG: hypothetical protein OXQ94_16860 [Gemmatimonadota bacterium]|nr:hypothetical protein [Gemmatimonadota bacterium]MDE2873350.1 hypothetical protein [Gemmatimonadota bacterium]